MHPARSRSMLQAAQATYATVRHAATDLANKTAAKQPVKKPKWLRRSVVEGTCTQQK